MIHHSAVSLDYLEERLQARVKIWVKETDATGREGRLRAWMMKKWRSQGYAYAPPCDNVKPDGQCAEHEKEATL